jgi:hypothetical protein
VALLGGAEGARALDTVGMDALLAHMLVRALPSVLSLHLAGHRREEEPQQLAVGVTASLPIHHHPRLLCVDPVSKAHAHLRRDANPGGNSLGWVAGPSPAVAGSMPPITETSGSSEALRQSVKWRLAA